MIIEVVSKLSADGYCVLNDHNETPKFYGCWQANEVKKEIEKAIEDCPQTQVIIAKGRNTFTGKDISDDLFESLVKKIKGNEAWIIDEVQND